MGKKGKSVEERRSFLKMAAGGAAALVAQNNLGNAQQQTAMARPAEEIPPDAESDGLTTDRPGSDFMVDVLKKLPFEYIAANPGSSFRSLQESFINYGGNKTPEWLTACHEESSVALAHGYFKVEGRPMAVVAHGTVGLQHASMGIYNAFCDRVPIYLILGNTFDATMRRPGAEWVHSVQDAAAMVRDYVKWDDMPVSLAHFAESAVRAYKIAMTPPMEPVVLVADSELQERPMSGPNPRIPRLTLTAPPQGDSGAVKEIARLLVAAENPVLVADRLVRTPNGMKLFVELAETLQAAVIDTGSRMNFPSRHPLKAGNAAVGSADVILGLEVDTLWSTVNSMNDQLHRTTRSRLRAGAKLLSITSQELYMKSNYQDFQRFQEVDIAVGADAEATLPALIEEVKKLVTAERKSYFADRGAKLAAAQTRARERTRAEAAQGWDASPISTARIAAELWAQIKNKDWAMVSRGDSMSGWPQELWDFSKSYQHIGESGGVGVGYSAPAAVGAALAHKKHGRLCLNLQNDGDLMYAPGVFWTAAHHRIPMLTIMNNNRAYHAEVMHLQRMANRHNRNITTAHIGNVIDNPAIDYAKVAQGLGWYAEGPISDPKEVGPAIRRALAVVERGEPALLDTVMQPR